MAGKKKHKNKEKNNGKAAGKNGAGKQEKLSNKDYAREMEKLDRDCGRYERSRGSSERGPRGEDERRAEQLGLADHGCERRAADVGCDVTQSFTAFRELGPVARGRHDWA